MCRYDFFFGRLSVDNSATASDVGLQMDSRKYGGHDLIKTLLIQRFDIFPSDSDAM